MKFLLITFTSCFLMAFAGAEEAEERFDNWFFSFFKGETEVYGEYYSADGKMLEEGSGLMKSVVDSQKGERKSESSITFKVSGDTVKSTSVLKPVGEGKFSGTAEDSKGNSYTMDLEVMKDDKYRTIAKGKDGQTIKIEGELKDDGFVHAKEEISIDGKLTFTSEIRYAKKEVVDRK